MLVDKLLIDLIISSLLDLTSQFQSPHISLPLVHQPIPRVSPTLFLRIKLQRAHCRPGLMRHSWLGAPSGSPRLVLLDHNFHPHKGGRNYYVVALGLGTLLTGQGWIRPKEASVTMSFGKELANLGIAERQLPGTSEFVNRGWFNYV